MASANGTPALCAVRKTRLLRPFFQKEIPLWNSIIAPVCNAALADRKRTIGRPANAALLSRRTLKVDRGDTATVQEKRLSRLK